MRRFWILVAVGLIFAGSIDLAAARSRHLHHGSGVVHVHGYYRKNGTYVHGYTRSRPSHHSESERRAHQHRESRADRTPRCREISPGVWIGPESKCGPRLTAHKDASRPHHAPSKWWHNSTHATSKWWHELSHAASGWWHRSSGFIAHKIKRDSNGRIERSTGAKHAFKRLERCPSTGQPRGPCPSYVIDHIIPLDCGGADAPSNMQWQTIKAAKAKDEIECGGHRCSKRHHTCSL